MLLYLRRNGEFEMNKNDLMKKYFFVTCFPEIENGWLPLLDAMCQEISKIIKANELEYKNLEFPFEFVQIKEKYGRLVCYPSFANEAIWDIIDKYEEESITICEICGMKGKLRDLPWVMTLCDKHFSMKLKELRNKGVDV